MKRWQLILCAVLIALVLTGCGGGAGPLPPSAGRPAADLEVTNRRSVTVPGQNQVAVLSPNGKWLAASIDRTELCILTVDSLTKKCCVNLEGCAIDPSSLAWSPGSQRVALTEHGSAYFESDLWVLEIESGRLTNLTDDGVIACDKPGEGHPPVPIDLLPVWLPDGKMLAFYRSTEQETPFLRIAAGGGIPEKVANVSFGSPALWTDAGNVVYTPLTGSPEETGLWIAEKDGQNPRRLLGEDDKLGPPLLMHISPGGDKALIIYRKFGRQTFFSEPNVSYCAVVDLNTGDVEPLKRATGNAAEFYGPTDATFSPDGSKVLYVHRDASDRDVLAVRDLDGGTENVLLTLQEREVFSGHGRGITWAENDTIYLPWGQALLTLGTK